MYFVSGNLYKLVYTLTIITPLFFAGCSSKTLSLAQRIEKIEQNKLFTPDQYMFLPIDGEGNLLGEQSAIVLREKLVRHRDALKSDGVTRKQKIVILAFGWGAELGETQEYADTLNSYVEWLQSTPAASAESAKGDSRVALYDTEASTLDEYFYILIGWDGSSKIVRRAVADTLQPFRGLGSIFYPLDIALFPFTFWSKAFLADIIGFVTIPEVLEYALSEYPTDHTQDGKFTPDIYLVGHSFGARMLSRMLYYNSETTDPAKQEIFAWRRNIEGAILIQPAVASRIQQDAEWSSLPCPVFVTRSDYDYALKRLFPLGNLLFNTEVAAFGIPEIRFEARREDRAPQIGAYTTLGTFVSLPGGFVLTTLGAFYGSFRELTSDILGFLPNTLAQVPLVEGVIQIIFSPIRDWRGDDTPNYGTYRKGAFNLGPFVNALGDPGFQAGLIAGESDTLLGKSPIYAFGAELRGTICTIEPGSKIPNGFYVLDYSDSIKQSHMLGVDLSKPWKRTFLLGSFSIRGAHSRYKVGPVFELLNATLHNKHDDLLRIIGERGTLATKVHHFGAN